jgi:hypothetical protein
MPGRWRFRPSDANGSAVELSLHVFVMPRLEPPLAARPGPCPPSGIRKLSHRGYRVNLRFIDWIWHIRGSLALAPGQLSDDAFDRLDPLFRQTGTSHQRTNDTLTFSKKDHAAQDKMSIFDGGALRIDKGVAGSVLRYHLISRALLFCFLAPLLFLGIAQFTIVINKFEKPPAEAPKKHAVMPMNPIDKALGAPAPDTSKKADADAAGKRGKKPSPKPAYIFAGIFATLYVVGRILEDRLIKSLFKKRLLET